MQTRNLQSIEVLEYRQLLAGDACLAWQKQTDIAEFDDDWWGNAETGNDVAVDGDFGTANLRPDQPGDIEQFLLQFDSNGDQLFDVAETSNVVIGLTDSLVSLFDDLIPDESLDFPDELDLPEEAVQDILQAVGSILPLFDVDNDGLLSIEELTSPPDEETILRNEFIRIDTDNNQFVTLQEVAAGFESDASFDLNEAATGFARADTNGDDRVSVDEFIAAFQTDLDEFEDLEDCDCFDSDYYSPDDHYSSDDYSCADEVATDNIIGDVNSDGAFDSDDLAGVLQASKYETGEAATWAEGDWNEDGQFDSNDLIAALASGRFSASP